MLKELKFKAQFSFKMPRTLFMWKGEVSTWPTSYALYQALIIIILSVADLEGFQWFPLKPPFVADRSIIVLSVSMHHERFFGFHVASLLDKVSRPTKKHAMAHLSIIFD